MEMELSHRQKYTPISLEDSIHSVLNQYKTISLSEMDSVKLMDRVDTKYVFTKKELPAFLACLNDQYSVLDVNGNRISRYESLYFDSPDFELYNLHHRGKTNRYKFRVRKYVESDLSFFEIKFKNNKGRTKKTRIKADTIDPHFLESSSNWKIADLEEKIWVNYSRITLVNLQLAERVTIDLNLEFIHEGKRVSLENYVIVEVKQGKNSQSPFTQLMHENHVREGSVSKYCLGIMHLYPNVRSNNFKHFKNKLKKILIS